MARFQLVVNGVDVSALVVQDGWSVAQNWSRQGDTASFLLEDAHPDPAVLTFTPTPLATVVFTDTANNQVVFSGVVPRPQLRVLSSTLIQWQLDCADWTYLSDRQLVAGDYSNYTADQLAVAITTAANCGITAAPVASGGFVAPGPMIPRIQFNYDTLTQAWTRISKLASVSTTYGWYVDPNRNLHFTTLAQAASSGVTFTDNPTQFTQPATYPYIQDTFAYEWDATSIRNTITVRGADYSQTQTDLFVGNGSQASFPLTFVPDSTNVATATLLVGGVTKTLAVQTGSDATTDWSLQGNAANQWFLTTNTDPTPAPAVIIQLVYPFLQPALSRVSDPTSIARFKNLPNGGVFAFYIADTALPTLLSAQQRGLREVSSYSQPVERCQLDSTPDFAGFLRAGQLIQVINTTVPDSQRALAVGFTGTFVALQLRINGEIATRATYQVTAARLGV